jgi:hypothetical protein
MLYVDRPSAPGFKENLKGGTGESRESRIIAVIHSAT